MPEQFQIEFNELRWTAFGINSYIQMSFSTSLQHNTKRAALSQKITVETTANTVEFLSDPPSLVSVNEIFQVTVKVTISGGTPLPGAPVYCNVTKAMSFSSIAAEIFSSLANSNYNIQKSNFLAPGSKLDEKRTNAITDNDGIAKLYIRIRESPVDSSVRLVCQSGKSTTSPSSKIKVVHTIKDIKVHEGIHETVKKTFNRDEGKFLPTQITLKSTIQLDLYKYKNTEIDIIRAEDVKIDLVTYEELEEFRAGNISIIESVNDIRKVATVSDTFDELWNIINTVIRSVQTVKAIKEQQKRVSNVMFNRPIITDTTITITNITLKVEEPDDYALIFSANGVYTDIFGNEVKLTIQDKIPVMKRIFDYVQAGLMVGFFFLVLFFASKFVKGYWMFLSLLVVSFFTYMFTYKDDNTLFFRVLVYVFAGIIGLFLLRASIIYFVDTFVYKREPSYFFNRKRKYFIEYTFQRLNGHPSNYWVNAKQKRKLKLKNFYNDADEKFRELHPERVFNNAPSDDNLDEESKDDVNLNINHSFISNSSTSINNDETKLKADKILKEGEHRASLNHGLLSEYTPPLDTQNKKYTKDELKALPMDSILYDDQTLKQKLMRCFIPFDILYRRIWIKDCFIYPQIFIASMVITLFSMGYIGYKTVSFILKVSVYIDDGYQKVYTSAFTFIRTGLEKYFLLFKYEPTKDEFGHYFNKLDEVGDRVHQLAIAIKIGASIGFVIAVVAIVINFLWIMYDYKRHVLLVRKGTYEFNKYKVPLYINSMLPAAIISNSIFMYVLIMIVLTIVCSIVCWTVTWFIMWKLKWILLDLIIGVIINFLLRSILNYLCYDFDSIKRRWLLGIFDFILLNLTILSGIATAAKRFSILFGILFASLFRIDVNSMPGWISRIVYLDTFNKAYFSSILVQHYLNNPILVTFYTLIFKITKSVNSNKTLNHEQREHMNKRKMIRNR